MDVAHVVQDDAEVAAHIVDVPETVDPERVMEQTLRELDRSLRQDIRDLRKEIQRLNPVVYESLVKKRLLRRCLLTDDHYERNLMDYWDTFESTLSYVSSAEMKGAIEVLTSGMCAITTLQPVKMELEKMLNNIKQNRPVKVTYSCRGSSSMLCKQFNSKPFP
jgi:hypothetical protein